MYERVYRTLVIKRIFIIKCIVFSCGYYKRMHLTTGVYGIIIISYSNGIMITYNTIWLVLWRLNKRVK